MRGREEFANLKSVNDVVSVRDNEEESQDFEQRDSVMQQKNPRVITLTRLEQKQAKESVEFHLDFYLNQMNGLLGRIELPKLSSEQGGITNSSKNDFFDLIISMYQLEFWKKHLTYLEATNADYLKLIDKESFDFSDFDTIESISILYLEMKFARCAIKKLNFERDKFLMEIQNQQQSGSKTLTNLYAYVETLTNSDLITK